MKDKEILTDDNIDYFNQLGSYTLCAKSNLINTDLEIVKKFNYNWSSLDKMDFKISPMEIKRSDKEIMYKFFHNPEQKKQIINALKIHPDHPNGAPMIYQQNIKTLYRNFDQI